MYKFEIDTCVISDVGRIRSNNEDNYHLCGQYRADVNENRSSAHARVIDKRVLLSVCDGMGGEAFGEEASLIAVSGLRPASLTGFRTVATEDVLALNEKVVSAGREKGSTRMGSTLSNLYIDKGCALAVNVGDSRIYLLRDGALRQLSVDHDETTRLVSLGILTTEQAKTDKRRHQLTQYLGMSEDDIVPEPYFSDLIELEDGDCFLLCSDGITDVLEDDAIAATLTQNPSPATAAAALVAAALDSGSKDNCTALIARIRKKPVLLYSF